MQTDPRLLEIKAKFDELLTLIAAIKQDGVEVQLKSIHGTCFELKPNYWSLVVGIDL